MNTQTLLRQGTSLDQATRYLHEGRITQRTFDWFWLFAAWAAPRFSGVPGFRQDRFYNRCGKDAYWRRIERFKSLYDRVVKGEVKLCA